MKRKRKVFRGYQGEEIDRVTVAKEIKAYRYFGCECQRVIVRSAKAIEVNANGVTIRFWFQKEV